MINLHPKAEFKPSPHFSNRGGKSIECVVLHYTAGGSARGSISWAQNPESKVSWHFIISRSGELVQQVPLECSAWHSGASQTMYRGEMKHGVNRFSIGIELANHGYLHKGKDGRFYYELAGNMRLYRQKGTPVEAKLTYDNGNVIEGWWEPYPDVQIDTLITLLLDLKQFGYGKAVSNIVGHEEIAMPFGNRKRDPGPLFPWGRFGRLSNRRTTGEII